MNLGTIFALINGGLVTALNVAAAVDDTPGNGDLKKQAALNAAVIGMNTALIASGKPTGLTPEQATQMATVVSSTIDEVTGIWKLFRKNIVPVSPPAEKTPAPTIPLVPSETVGKN